MTLLGVGSFFLCLAFGVLCLRSFALTESNLLLGGGVAVGLLSQLFFLNTLLRTGIPFNASVYGSMVMLGVGSVALWFGSRTRERLFKFEVGLGESLIVGVGAISVWVATNASQMSLIDQDYWLHTPLQRFLLDGMFPPQNPYFLDLRLHGHYGRDLLIACYAAVSGWDTFRAQALLTSFSQALSLWVLYFTCRFHTQSWRQASLITAFLFLGSNVSYRAGWIDEFVAHASLTHLHWTVLPLFLGFWWKKPDLKSSLWFGVVSGAHALVFTTTFCTHLVVLFLLSFCAEFHDGSRRRSLALVMARAKPYLKSLVWVASVGVLVAIWQGGAVSHWLSGQPEATQATQNQSQSVEVRFPKSPFLGILKQENDGARSCIYDKRPFDRLYRVLERRGARYDSLYVPIWSWDFLRLHWMTVYLAPWTGVYLIRRRNYLGLYFWCFGLVSFLTPGLFDFGPVHEYDWLRWVFWTGFGFAAAFATMLGDWLDRAEGRSRIWKAVWVLILTGCNTLAGLSFLVFNTPQNVRIQGGLWNVLGYRLTTPQWLQRQGEFPIGREPDLAAMDWLRMQGVSKKRILIHFDPPVPNSILFESTLAGRTGAYPIGHRLPTDLEPIGLPPSSLSPQALELLYGTSRAALRVVEPDWIYLCTSNAELVRRLEELPEVVSGYRTLGEGGLMRVVLQVRRVQDPKQSGHTWRTPQSTPHQPEATQGSGVGTP